MPAINEDLRKLKLPEAQRNDIYNLLLEHLDPEYIEYLNGKNEETLLTECEETLQKVPAVYYITLKGVLKGEDISEWVDIDNFKLWNELIGYMKGEGDYKEAHSEDRLNVFNEMLNHMVEGDVMVKDPQKLYNEYEFEYGDGVITKDDIEASNNAPRSRKDCEAFAKEKIKKLEADYKTKQADRKSQMKQQMKQSKADLNAQLKKLKSEGKMGEYNTLKKYSAIFEKENKAYLKAQESYEKLQMEQKKIEIRAEQTVRNGEKPLATDKDVEKAMAKCEAAKKAFGEMKIKMGATAADALGKDENREYRSYFTERQRIVAAGDLAQIINTTLWPEEPARQEPEAMQAATLQQEAPAVNEPLGDRLMAALETNRQTQGRARVQSIEARTLTINEPQKKGIEIGEF